MKPGPATSALRMPAPAGSMRPTSSSAICRGALRSGLASVIATLVAQSPCSGLRWRSSTTDTPSSTPISRRARSISACSLSAAIYSLLLVPPDDDPDPPDEDEPEDLDSGLGAADDSPFD